MYKKRSCRRDTARRSVALFVGYRPRLALAKDYMPTKFQVRSL